MLESFISEYPARLQLIHISAVISIEEGGIQGFVHFLDFDQQLDILWVIFTDT